jgi:hypothetical protein
VTARVSIRDLWGVLLPRGCSNGRVAMLKAYFDDSGTQGPSKVVVMAGVIGTEPDLLSLEGFWQDHLDNPLCGLKDPLTEFKAYDCYHSKNEFAGWKRKETDYFRHQLREAIIKSHVGIYGFCVIRDEYDDIISGDLRTLMGDAEKYTAINCFIGALAYARSVSFDPQIAFVFDKKPERQKENERVFQSFQLWERSRDVVGITFADSKKLVALQAADLIAWEARVNGYEILEKDTIGVNTEELLHIGGGVADISIKIARRDKLEVVKQMALREHDAEIIKAGAAYFKNLDRSDPDGDPPS